MFVTSYQGRKYLGSRGALLPGKFWRVKKVKVRMLEKDVKLFFQGCQIKWKLSGWFQNCSVISRWSQFFPDSFETVQIFPDSLKTFRIVSKLFGYF